MSIPIVEIRILTFPASHRESPADRLVARAPRPAAGPDAADRRLGRDRRTGPRNACLARLALAMLGWACC
ncbi:hypothetical protein, partial [Burkholderia glumae]